MHIVPEVTRTVSSHWLLSLETVPKCSPEGWSFGRQHESPQNAIPGEGTVPRERKKTGNAFQGLTFSLRRSLLSFGPGKRHGMVVAPVRCHHYSKRPPLIEHLWYARHLLCVQFLQQGYQ